jgi:hypothetical protein
MSNIISGVSVSGQVFVLQDPIAIHNNGEYWTSAQTQNAINEAVSGLPTSGDVDIISGEVITIQTELNNKLDASAYTPTDLSNYDTKSEVNNKISSATSLVYNALTAHTANSDVHVTSAEKTTWDNKLDSSALNDYATKSYVSGYTYDKATIDEKIAGGGTFDPTQYYTKTQTDEKISQATSGKVDTSVFSAYSASVQTALDGKVDDAEITDMATKTWVGQQVYLTEHQSLSGYATTAVTTALSGAIDTKLDATAYTPTDLSNYYTKSETSGATEISTALGNKLDTSVFNSYSAATNTAISNKADSSSLNNYLLKSKIWCGTQAEYDLIITKDSETLYLIHS